jgi:hypothetical protein
VPLSASPEQGHETHRAGVSIGWRNNELFEEVQLRAAYHDLLDPDTGYLPDAQIEMAGISVRHYEGQDQYRVERLTAVNIVSIAPIDAAFRQPSWKLNVGMQSLKPHRPDAGCRYCSTGIVSGGVGGAVESQLFRRLIGFSFAEFEGDVGGGYDDFYRIGGGGTVGVLAQITERWKLLASATYLRFPIGDKSDDVRASVGQRYTISRNVAVRLEYNHRRHDDEALLTLHAFF